MEIYVSCQLSDPMPKSKRVQLMSPSFSVMGQSLFRSLPSPREISPPQEVANFDAEDDYEVRKREKGF